VVEEALKELPENTMLVLTSRPLGFNAAERNRSAFIARLSKWHLRPLSDRVISYYINSWYKHRSNQTEKAEALYSALKDNDHLLTLARTPNLLSLMCIVYRSYATLPSGRALLYEKITEAYLETIPKAKGLEHLSEVSLEQKQRWLSEVGIQMQRKREITGDKFSLAETLIARNELLFWIERTIADEGLFQDHAMAEAFLEMISRRAGLLLPRTESLFSFIHLSFQEFYAARHLSDRFAMGGIDPDEYQRALQELKTWSSSIFGCESALLTFELLASKPRLMEGVLAQLIDGIELEENENLNLLWFLFNLNEDESIRFRTETKEKIENIMNKIYEAEQLKESLLLRESLSRYA
jgi:hypothetical protein